MAFTSANEMTETIIIVKM